MTHPASYETTMSALCEMYMIKHSRLKKKPSSVKLDQWYIDHHIRPYFGKRQITDITSKDVCQFHFLLQDTPTQANRLLEVLSKMFNLAERWGLRSYHSNPCRHVDRYPERQVNRFLKSDELIRLWQVLETREAEGSESRHVIAAFRLLILTGCRVSEIQFLRWEQVDWHEQALVLTDSKTGPRHVSLNAPAMEVLRQLKMAPSFSPWVILNRKTGKPIQYMQKPWRRIRKEAGIEDVRIHDLRHTFASTAISAGLSLPALGKLLGHRQPQTTQRYAHVAPAFQREAAHKVGERMASALRSVDTRYFGEMGGCGGRI